MTDSAQKITTGHTTNSFQVYRRLLKWVKPYLGLFILGVFATMFGGAVDASLTWMLKPLIDKGFVAKDMRFIQWLPFGIIAIFLVRGITTFLSNYYMIKVGRNIVRDARINVFNHLMQLPANFFDQRSSGALLSLIVFNTEQIAEASTFAITTIAQEGCLIIGYIAVMLIISWQLTLLFLLTAPLILLVVRFSSIRLRRLSGAVQQSMAHVSHVAEESIEGYRVVRTFGGEDYEKRKFTDAAQQNRNQEMKAVVTNTLGTSFVQIIAAVPIALTLYLATGPIQNISAGSFAAMIAAMIAILRPIRRFTRVNNMIQKGLAGAQSVFELLDESPEDDTGKQTIKRARGAIEFDHVSFNYTSKDEKVLSDISFAISPGETIAIVGRSGAGKSTLVNMLPRFYEINSGKILLDGVDIRDYHLRDLRQQFSYVSQSVSLFNDTIANNIAYASPDKVSRDELERVANAAHALEFIERFPRGFDTVIGEDGVLLSGGQRQRIAIARAILKDAPILILDEATSALDTEAERHIQAALEQLMEQRTTLVIAHRLSTVEKADRILVMERGRITQLGTHKELMALGGLYAQLHAMQFAGVVESVVKSSVIASVS